MSLFSALFSRELAGMEEALGAKDITSEAMKRAIRSWFALYFETERTEEADPCQRIPYLVVNKLTKTVFSEYAPTVKNPFLANALAALDDVRKKAMQLALIGGGCYLKPVPLGGGFAFVVVRRDSCLVLGREVTGKVTDLASWEKLTIDGRHYTLLERRTVGADGLLRIQNRLFVSLQKELLGSQVPLATLERYAALEETMTLQEPLGLGMAWLATPMVNCVDGSEDAVAVYAPAMGLIQAIDRNEAQIHDEFDNGASRILASSDLMERDERGKRRLRDKQFVGLDDDPEHVGITIFSPALREQSFLARKQEYLRNVESQIGLKRGILSEVEAAERTATEITSSAGDYNLTIVDFQQAWETAAGEALVICAALGRLYRLDAAAAFVPEDLTIDWGDGVLYNRDKTWAEYKEMVAAGMLDAAIALAWYFSLPFPETEEERADIRARYMPAMQELLGDDMPLQKGASPQGEGAVVEAAEDVAGKSLNGAQTQSLIAVIAQMQAGQLTPGQAVNIIAIAIGISKEEAQKIIEGAS